MEIETARALTEVQALIWSDGWNKERGNFYAKEIRRLETIRKARKRYYLKGR